MQDLRSMATGGTGTGRMFGTAGDRRMRPHHPPQALKCPRCDSLNTKFCYYNNYNLSQPRHFCKSCRRYWTKGGVLRNVPVGGGCRKTKRSSTKPKPETHHRSDPKPSSHSSSDSSSLTAAATVAATAAEVASASPLPLNYGNPPFDPPAVIENFNPPSSDPSIFPETGSFTSLMTASNPSILGFNFGGLTGNATLPFQFQRQQQQQQKMMMSGMVEEMKMQELTAGFLNQTVPVELPQLGNRGGNGGLTALDWQSNGDQELFDLTGGLDQSYWSNSQWGENDHSLYHLP